MSILNSLRAYEKKSSSGTKYANWAEAKAASLGKDGVLKQLDPNNTIGCFKNSPNPAAWIVQDWDKSVPKGQPMKKLEEYYISWRIGSNPVYFTPEMAEAKQGYIGTFPSAQAARDALKALGDEIRSGNWDAQCQEAFERTRKAKAESELV